MSAITLESLAEAFAKKDAEIERLMAENARLKLLNLMTDEQVVMDLKAEIELLKAEILRRSPAREAEPATVVSADGKSFMDAPAPQRAREATR